MEKLPLLSSDFLSRLDHLTLIARRLHRRGSQGQTQSYRKGSSLEFREYRPYRSGDDVRFVDWNVWERLETLVTKVFSAEEDRTLYLLVDSSGSMKSGEPSKLRFASETAAAIAYIAGRRQDRVGVFSLSDDIKSYRRPSKGSGSLLEAFRFLEGLEASGRTDLSAALGRLLESSDRSGIAVILTDLLDSGDYREGIRRLRYRRFDVILIHILSNEDCSPQVQGPLLLKDCESGGTLRVTSDQNLLDTYRRNFSVFCSDVEYFCAANGVEYFRALSSDNFENFILDYLRRSEHIR